MHGPCQKHPSKKKKQQKNRQRSRSRKEAEVAAGHAGLLRDCADSASSSATGDLTGCR